MSYSISLVSIDDSPLNIEALKRFCQTTPKLKFDESQTWTNLYDQIVLAEIEKGWDFVCGIKNNSTRAECADPGSSEYSYVTRIADSLSLFIIGEENEIYYIPNHGKPKMHLDFELAKKAYNKFGLTIDLIIENSQV
jgi:hypothetical protein